jgi:hypothetical protein
MEHLQTSDVIGILIGVVVGLITGWFAMRSRCRPEQPKQVEPSAPTSSTTLNQPVIEPIRLHLSNTVHQTECIEDSPTPATDSAMLAAQRAEDRKPE